jgi:hypothetical protein
MLATRPLRHLVVVLSLAGIAAAAAGASPLDQAACEALKADRGRLLTESLKSDIAKGAEWARANLSQDRLKEIQSLIEVEEQIAFRCPHPRPVLPETAAGGAQIKLAPVRARSDADPSVRDKHKKGGAAQPAPEQSGGQSATRKKARSTATDGAAKSAAQSGKPVQSDAAPEPQTDGSEKARAE